MTANQNSWKTGVMLGLAAGLMAMLLVRSGSSNVAAPGLAAAMSSSRSSQLLDAPIAPNAPRVAAADSNQSYRKWLSAELPAALTRNPFTTTADYYPVDATRPGEDSRTYTDDDARAKSLSSPADQEDRVNRAQHLRQQAAGLRLESTVMGSTPRALINGEMVEEGEVVAYGSDQARTSFRVVKIEARRIIVEREGIKLEIPMK